MRVEGKECDYGTCSRKISTFLIQRLFSLSSGSEMSEGIQSRQIESEGISTTCHTAQVYALLG